MELRYVQGSLKILASWLSLATNDWVRKSMEVEFAQEEVASVWYVSSIHAKMAYAHGRWAVGKPLLQYANYPSEQFST